MMSKARPSAYGLEKAGLPQSKAVHWNLSGRRFTKRRLRAAKVLSPRMARLSCSRVSPTADKFGPDKFVVEGMRHRIQIWWDKYKAMSPVISIALQRMMSLSPGPRVRKDLSARPTSRIDLGAHHHPNTAGTRSSCLSF